MRKKDNDGFTLVELIVVIVILAILIGVTITGITSWINKARINTDINNASALNKSLGCLSTKPEVIYWAKKSDETHIMTWSYCADGLKTHGVTAKYFIPQDDTGAGKFSNYSWAYLFQRYITFSQNQVNSSYDGDTEKCLPQSRTGDGFMIIVTRDGKGNSNFISYALCDLTDDDIDDIISKYSIVSKEVNWIKSKGGK